MNLADVREAYYALSGKASDAVRQLAFAGIALVWIFRNDKQGPLAVPIQLLEPTALLVLALALDLLQYLSGALIWGIYQRYKERKLGASSQSTFAAPELLNAPAVVCFWLKSGCTGLAYANIFLFIAAQLTAP